VAGPTGAGLVGASSSALRFSVASSTGDGLGITRTAVLGLGANAVDWVGVGTRCHRYLDAARPGVGLCSGQQPLGQRPADARLCALGNTSQV
jgi:hypothetical protein